MTATTAGYGATVTVQGVTVYGEMNRRDHWAVKQARARLQQAHTLTTLTNLGTEVKARLLASPTIGVRFVRLGGKKLDSDNLVSGFKAIRDAVAKWFKVDDGSDRFRFECAQEPAKEKGFRIEFKAE